MWTLINMQNKSTDIHAVTCQTSTFTVTTAMKTKLRRHAVVSGGTMGLLDTPLHCGRGEFGLTPPPSPPETQSGKTLTSGPAHNLHWQAATTNQSVRQGLHHTPQVSWTGGSDSDCCGAGMIRWTDARFDLPAQTSIRLTWLRPSASVLPLDTATLCKHAWLESEDRDKGGKTCKTPTLHLHATCKRRKCHLNVNQFHLNVHCFAWQVRLCCLSLNWMTFGLIFYLKSIIHFKVS